MNDERSRFVRRAADVIDARELWGGVLNIAPGRQQVLLYTRAFNDLFDGMQVRLEHSDGRWLDAFGRLDGVNFACLAYKLIPPPQPEPHSRTIVVGERAPAAT